MVARAINQAILRAFLTPFYFVVCGGIRVELETPPKVGGIVWADMELTNSLDSSRLIYINMD
jgi:hypothetical protein